MTLAPEGPRPPPMAAAWGCDACTFELWLPLAPLRVSHAGLYDDARFPGRCLLALDEHHEDIAELPESLLSDFLLDLRDVSHAIKAVTGVQRVDSAILGNTVPHVHWHVVPGQPSREERGTQSPWEDPRERTALPAQQFSRLQSRLTDHLSRPRSRA